MRRALPGGISLRRWTRDQTLRVIGACLGAALATVVLSGTESHAADQAVTGKKLLLKNGKLVLLSKDASIGIAGSDPVNGSDSSVSFDAGGGAVSFSLPKTLWAASGSGAVLKYKNGAAPGGPSPVKVAKVKSGGLKVVAKDLPFAVPNGAATIGVTLSLDGGTNTYCMTFSGTGNGRKFLVKDAAAGACAPTPTPTPALGCCSGLAQVCAANVTIGQCTFPAVFVPGGICAGAPGGQSTCMVPGTPTPTVPPPTPTATPVLGCCSGVPQACSATLTVAQCPFPGIFVPGGTCAGGGGNGTCVAPGTPTPTVPPPTPTATPVLGCCAGLLVCLANSTSAECPNQGVFIPGGTCVGPSTCVAPGTPTQTSTPTETGVPPTATPTPTAGSQQLATLLINEVNPNISGGKDLVELLATTAGSINGVTLQQDVAAPVTLATLPNVTVAAGDLIVIHLAPDTTTTETSTKGDCTDGGCYAGAWDVNGGITGITFSNRVLRLVAPDNSVADAVPFAKVSTTSPSGYPADLQAIQAAGQWLPADCGGALCSYASTPLASDATISVDWTTAGPSAIGTSVQRKSGAATRTSADWTPAAQTFGLNN